MLKILSTIDRKVAELYEMRGWLGTIARQIFAASWVILASFYPEFYKWFNMEFLSKNRTVPDDYHAYQMGCLYFLFAVHVVMEIITKIEEFLKNRRR